MKFYSLLFFITLTLFAFLGVGEAIAIDTFQIHKIPALNGGNLTIQDFVKVLYNLAIGIAAALTVIMIMWAGVQYMLSEVVTNKENAKKTIQNSLLGLVIILSTALILQTINPNLRQLNFLQNANSTKTVKSASKPPTQCPSGQVWAECEADDGSISSACINPGDRSWCVGSVVENPTTPPINELWRKIVSTVLEAGEAADTCVGRPEQKILGAGSILVICHVN